MAAVFYKIYSNLGIKGMPNRQKERNDGVYYGPDAVLGKNFLKSYKAREVRAFCFVRAEKISGKNLYRIFALEAKKCKREILASLRGEDALFAIGGDNSITLPVLLSDIERFGADNVGILFFDTHGDIHSRVTSPSGNFHGMYLRPFFGKFDAPEIEKLVPRKFSGKDIVYFGGEFDFEKEEEEFMDRLKIRRFSKNEIRKNFGAVKKRLNDFLRTHRHIHVNFDIDVFDKSLVRATGMPSESGLSKKDVFKLLKIISKHSSKTVSLSELNPEKKGRNKTVKIAREVLAALR